MDYSISKNRELVYDAELCEDTGCCNSCMMYSNYLGFNMELNLMVDNKNIVEKPLHIYIRSGYDDVTSTDSTVVTKYNQVLPVKVETCDSWEDLSRLLKLNPHQIALHPNTFISSTDHPHTVSLKELIVLIKTHLKLEKKDIPIALVVEKHTPLHIIKEAQSMSLQGLIPYHGHWAVEDSLAGLDALTNRVTYWPEHIISQLPDTRPKPVHVLFRNEPDRNLHPMMNGAISAISKLGFKVLCCNSWDELSEALREYPHQIVAHIDMISHNGVTINEFVSMIETLVKVTVGKSIPLAIVIEKDTPLNVVKELQKTSVMGIIPSGYSFGMDEGMRGVEALSNRIPYWPKHILQQLPGAKKTVVKNSIILTPRQVQIANLISERGLSNKKIAQSLKITESTVKIHVSAILKAYGVRTRTQLVVVANK